MKFEVGRIHFLSDVFVAVAVVVALGHFCKESIGAQALSYLVSLAAVFSIVA